VNPFVALAVLVSSSFAAPPTSDLPAVASCVGPTVMFAPTRVVRGGELTINGRHFGDDCLDTATLPPGVGPLGSPLDGLVIVINQGANEFVVATGSAEGDYTFHVDVVVPPGLEPGDAFINVLGAGDARLPVSPALVVSSATPLGTEAPVTTFGPQPTVDTEPPGSLPTPVLPADIPDEPLATTPPLLPAPVEADDGIGSSTELQRAIAVGVAGVVAIGAVGFAIWDRSRRRRR
jgi:hypothetical protein